MNRVALIVLASAVVLGVCAPSPAFAYDPPPSIAEITARTPSGDKPGGRIKEGRDVECATSARTSDVSFEHEPPASEAFGVTQLHKWATGAGVTVAVIDSGVTPNVRLPRLKGGGDYVKGGSGLEDCDHHGTLIAGIIAAQPSDKDAMIGVAPDASILSIRQTSLPIEASASSGDSSSRSRLDTVAQAIVRATNLGAQVINLSVTACASAEALVDTTDLGAALKYAHMNNVAVVASAGNASQECYSNPSYDPSHPGDRRNWAGVRGVSFPSYYAASGLLLSVGGVDVDGKPYENTMGGPWVSVAAPATRIISIDPSKGRSGTLTNGRIENNQPQELAGTSFAAAYVSGLMALLKERYPTANVEELYARVVRTAHTPSGDLSAKMGWGTVDATAALSSTIDTTWPADPHVSHKAMPMSPNTVADRIPMWSGLAVLAVCAIVVLLCLIGVATRRKTDDKEIM